MRRLLAVLGLILLLAPGAGGCYYAQVGFGQAKVLLGRESIEDALDSSSLSAEEKGKLALVPGMREFAQERIGLARNGSYTQFYDTGSRPISWNVSACSKTSFTPYLWSFPFVGEAPYKGFFDLESARAEARRLEAAGWDVVVREVGAYSTLGWFDDPIFRRMLAYDVYDLANTILHELTHATVFRAGDAAFNESVATFVGTEGALEYLRARHGARSREVRAARDRIADEQVFEDFVGTLYERLDRLYRSPKSEAEKLERREAICAAAKSEFEQVRRTRMRNPEEWRWFATKPLDNAVIIGWRQYRADMGAYHDAHRLCGGDWKRTLALFAEASQNERPKVWLASWRAGALAAARRQAEGAAAVVDEPPASEKGGDQDAGPDEEGGGRTEAAKG